MAQIVAVVLALAALTVQVVWGWPAAWAWITSSSSPDVALPSQAGPYQGPAEPPLVRLAVAGDVGTADAAEYATASAVDGLESSGEFTALLLLGDNIYPDGDPALADAAVFRPFGPVLDGGTALLAALGNHDVRTGDGEPERRALGLPGRWYARTLGPLELIVLDSNRVGDPDQLAWLEQTLAASRAPWTIVAQHHPPFSAGHHGSHAESRRLLVPLFERYGVDLVLAGHDHDYQRSSPQNGVTYVVSGGAATLRPTGTAEFTAAAASVHHFVELAVYGDRLEVRAVQQDRRVFDQVTLPANGSG